MTEKPFDDAASGWKPFWDEMGIGPLWVRRDAEDPFADDVPGFPDAPPVRNAVAKQPPASPQQPVRPIERTSPPPVRGGVPMPGAPARVQTPRPTETARPPHQSPFVEQPQPRASGVELSAAVKAAIAAADWETLCGLAEACRTCPMASSRQHVVFAEGAPGPKLVIVGEAPGGEEDLQGKPFVGKSGRLLTAMLEAVGVRRGRDAVILNTLKCRPPANRDPQPDELNACMHFLRRQLELLAPDVIFLIGRFAAKALLNSGEAPLGRLRGSFHTVDIAGRSIPAVVSYHPSYLLRSPDAKAKAWEDLCLLRRACRQAKMDFADRRPGIGE